MTVVHSWILTHPLHSLFIDFPHVDDPCAWRANCTLEPFSAVVLWVNAVSCPKGGTELFVLAQMANAAIEPMLFLLSFTSRQISQPVFFRLSCSLVPGLHLLWLRLCLLEGIQSVLSCVSKVSAAQWYWVEILTPLDLLAIRSWKYQNKPRSLFNCFTAPCKSFWVTSLHWYYQFHKPELPELTFCCGDLPEILETWGPTAIGNLNSCSPAERQFFGLLSMSFHIFDHICTYLTSIDR